MPDSSSTTLYDSFDDFLKTSLKEFYLRRGKTHPVEFAALLIASGQIISMGLDTFRGNGIGGKIAAGAVGAIALRAGLKYALSGPLGIIATGLSVASLGSYLVKNQDKLGKQIKHFKDQIAAAKQQYTEIVDNAENGRFRQEERNLMIDGLFARLLQDLCTPMPEIQGIGPRS